jgi:plasmid stabilization system protein ParE
MVIRWSRSAAFQLQEAYNYIRQFSPQSAIRVRDEKLKLANVLMC